MTISSTMSTISSTSLCRSATIWAPLGVGQAGMPAQHVEVGAQARQRRAQLVTGVLDEPLLLGAGAVERLQHRPERRPEAADLVVARRRHADIETAGRPHRVRRGRQPAQRCGDTCGDERAEQRRRGGDEEDEDDDPRAERLQHAIDLGQRAGHLHGPVGQTRRANAVASRPDRHGVDDGSARPPDDRPGGGVRFPRRRRREPHRAVGSEQLCLVEGRPRTAVVPVGEPVVAADECHRLGQRHVDLGVHAVAGEPGS